MKTLTPDQRMEGFTELEGVLGEGGVGGAHLMSFLAGVAHAEKVLTSQEQDDEPVAWIREVDIDNPVSALVRTQHECGDCNIPLYLHPEPKVPFVRLTDEELENLGGEYVGPMSDGEFHLMVITQNALEEKNR